MFSKGSDSLSLMFLEYPTDDHLKLNSGTPWSVYIDFGRTVISLLSVILSQLLSFFPTAASKQSLPRSFVL